MSGAFKRNLRSAAFAAGLAMTMPGVVKADTADSASTVVPTTAILGTAADQMAMLVTGTGVFHGNGAEADDDNAGGFSLWVDDYWTDLEDENGATAFEGELYAVMAGIDYNFSALTVGVAAGYENTDIDTAYNGFGGNEGNLEGDGYTIAPYLSYLLAPDARASLVLGHSNINYDTVRFDQGSGNRIAGSTDAERYFADLSFFGVHHFNERWRLHGKTSVFWALEEKDSFNEIEAGTGAVTTNAEEDNGLGQVRMEARLGYQYRFMEPYALTGIVHDFAKDEATVGAGQSEAAVDNSDWGAKLGGGVNLSMGPHLTGGVEAYTIQFREEYEKITVTGNLRFKF